MHGEGLLVTKTAARRKIDIGSDRYAGATNVDGRRWTRRRLTILVSLETFVSLCGLGGGLFMGAHPLTAMSLQYLHGTWFQRGVGPVWLFSSSLGYARRWLCWQRCENYAFRRLVTCAWASDSSRG
jgi:hypothetical protein